MTCLHNHDQILQFLRKIFLKGFQIYQNYLCALTLIRLGYFGGWKDWGGGGGGPIRPPLEISAVDRAITGKICTMVVCDVIYKIVYFDFPK